MQINCSACGRIFLRDKNQLLRNKNNYCSKQCMKKKISLNCISCGESFFKSSFHENHGKCRICYMKDFYQKNPEKLESKRNLNRNRLRQKNGISLDKPVRKRQKNGYTCSSGYRIIYKEGHKNSWNCGRIHEHVWIMSENLNRPLKEGENVHHKNGDRLDNRIENLELWSTKQPAGQRIIDKIKFYIEFLEQYPEIVHEYGYKLIKE